MYDKDGLCALCRNEKATVPIVGDTGESAYACKECATWLQEWVDMEDDVYNELKIGFTVGLAIADRLRSDQKKGDNQ